MPRRQTNISHNPARVNSPAVPPAQEPAESWDSQGRAHPVHTQSDHVSPPCEHDEPSGCRPWTLTSRYDLLHGIQRLLRDPETHKGPSVCGCGHAQWNVEWVNLSRDAEGRASADGITRCRSLYLCPVCTFRRALEIQERARRFADASIRAGCWVYMVTFTVRHDSGDALSTLRDHLSGAFRKAQQGAPYQRLQRAGLLGIFRTVEVRWSASTGWHPHLHCLVSVAEPNEPAARDIAQRLVERYLDQLAQHGAPADQLGQDVSLCHDPDGAAEYAAKGALELTGGAHKTSASGSLHPFQLARLAVEDEDKEAAARFQEYADAMPGVPQGRITERLIDQLATRLHADRDQLGEWLRHGTEADEPAKAPEPERQEPAEDVGRIYAKTWNSLVRDRKIAALLARIEQGASARELAREGWPIQEPPPRSEASAAPAPRTGEDITIAAHRTAPTSAPSGTEARSAWVRAYREAHTCAV